jgi:D-serine deaminase-like pyridoxal phosphate-dependent protein
MKIKDLETPVVLIEEQRMENNLQAMQDICTKTGTELWPHVKTHKMVNVLRRQLALGATGITCAKIGEAEALLPSGVRKVFVAHSIVDERSAGRLKALAGKLDELILAVTSIGQCELLEALLRKVSLQLPVLMAVDTGLDREGVRSNEDAVALHRKIVNSEVLTFRGLYTHEGHAYGSANPEAASEMAARVHARLVEVAEALGGDIALWPGCSVTAALMAGKPGVVAVRPGSYVFGDLALCESTGVREFDHAALTVLATVVDKPADDLALIDAGTKVFSSDKSAAGIAGREQNLRSIVVEKMNEEHGYLRGEELKKVSIGQRLRFVPAHVCTVVNLTSTVRVVNGDEVVATWNVEARGCTV